MIGSCLGRYLKHCSLLLLSACTAVNDETFYLAISILVTLEMFKPCQVWDKYVYLQVHGAWVLVIGTSLFICVKIGTRSR